MSNTPNKQQPFNVEVELWQGFIVISLVFILASILMFFGSIVPQAQANTLLENNQAKTNLYSDFSSTQGYDIDSRYSISVRETACTTDNFYNFDDSKNERYVQRLEEKRDYVQSLRPETYEFIDFVEGSEIYYNKYIDALNTQSEAGLELVTILNSLGAMCEETNKEALERYNEITVQIERWGNDKIYVIEDWVLVYNEFGSELEQITSERPNDSFSVSFENLEFKNNYFSLFSIVVNFDGMVEDLDKCQEIFEQALKDYEAKEFKLSSEITSGKNEILFFSPKYTQS